MIKKCGNPINKNHDCLKTSVSFAFISETKIEYLVHEYIFADLGCYAQFEIQIFEYSAVHLIQALLIRTGDYGPC